MPTPVEYPRLVKHGSAVVKIYRVKHRSTTAGHAYVVAWVTAGRRRLQQFASENDALSEARLKAAQLADGQTEVAEMTRSDRDELLAARDLCGSIPLTAALQEWRQAHDLTNGQVLPAARAWAMKNTSAFTRIDVTAAVDAFIAAKEKAGKQGERTYRSKLDPLKTVFKNRSLDSITVNEFTGYGRRPRASQVCLP